MVCDMRDDHLAEMDIEVLPSMWPEDLGTESGKKFNLEKPGLDQDMLEEVMFVEEPSIVDFKRLLELTNYSEKGSSQLTHLVKNWEYKQANAVRLLNEELDILNKQRQDVELKKLEILEEHRFEEEKYVGDKRTISILDDGYDLWEAVPHKKNDVIFQTKRVEIDADYDTIKYWKQRAVQLDKMLEASMQREQILIEKLQENVQNMERQSSPVEELSQILKRADNFLHFVLQNAPVVIGHQDKDLRYRFIYNHFPSLQEEDIIGKTDVEIFSGAGVKESQDFKKEVMERGLPAKREITFDTGLFGSKTFLIHVEPVFNKAGDTIGVNYMGMDMTDQVIKREKMAKLREEIAVQNAKETELNKTIHITEETMRAKQMLATMSHEIRSPLTGVVSMAEILSNTRLDREQQQLLDVMISSGDLVLQLINDILDLSKVESGVMTLEATRFRPREVVRHVLQTAAASLQKELILEGHLAEDIPVEVIGDVLRIRQILTNLISNAIKFTHEGRVGINLYVVPEPSGSFTSEQSADCANELVDGDSFATSQCRSREESHDQSSRIDDGPTTFLKNTTPDDENVNKSSHPHETTVWICCDVYDTGIGIPENAIPNLFKKYMQVSADHARKYGGTGLGLAICKQLVELMGGQLTVTSQEHCGSTFTFILPYKVSPKREQSNDPNEHSDMDRHEVVTDANMDDDKVAFFQFQPRTLGSLFSSGGSARTNKLTPNSNRHDPLNKLNNLSDKLYSFPSNSFISKETTTVEDACSDTNAVETFSDTGSSVKQDPGKSNENHESESCHSDVISNSPSKISMEVDNVDNCRKFQDTCQRHNHEKFDESSSSPCSSNVELAGSKLKPKILLAEDNKINVMVTKSLMKKLGHNIDVANNGVEAVHAYQSHRYDLILMVSSRI
ncbi:hypothetical protein GIB67_018650 [Kingdonia uniflora]|uniref:histidine kinase n=1 Tax=Kingdonia uniflora TaxID=39325 RepID=A0A7J7M2K9_9MAGN|nr:hypothetical protein GIB67_018650 [Kingdonia uniflora]